MTTASCMSLAQAILSEKSKGENVPTEVAADDTEETAGYRRTIQHQPSAFACALADHFPPNGYLELQLARVRADG